jgi:hypothetical protein
MSVLRSWPTSNKLRYQIVQRKVVMPPLAGAHVTNLIHRFYGSFTSCLSSGCHVLLVFLARRLSLLRTHLA